MHYCVSKNLFPPTMYNRDSARAQYTGIKWKLERRLLIICTIVSCVRYEIPPFWREACKYF